MLRIKIIGAEDKQQKMLLTNINQAIKQMGIETRIITITDWHDIINHDIIQTPALMVRTQVLSQGFVPTVEDIEKILRAFLPQEQDKTLHFQA